MLFPRPGTTGTWGRRMTGLDRKEVHRDLRHYVGEANTLHLLFLESYRNRRDTTVGQWRCLILGYPCIVYMKIIFRTLQKRMKTTTIVSNGGN